MIDWAGREVRPIVFKELRTKNFKDMTITEKEIREDFARFIRHEAMRANCTQDDIKRIIESK